jgi:hypothetical protein
MTTRKYSSRSQQTTLSGALTSSATTTTVVSGSSLLGGVTISAGELFTIVIDPDTALEEIVDVSATSGNTLTIVRAIDGSTGVAHSAGAIVRHMAIGRDYREANTHIEATTGHGATGAVVGTTNTQTLTNKTLTSPTITGTGAIAGTFTGNLTGNVTGNVSGTSGSTTGNAATVTNGIYTTDTGTVTSTMIADGTIVNADINASAAIDKTKISGTAVTVADTGTVTSTMILDGTILNADVNSAAAIDKTKISGTAVTLADVGTVTGTMIATDTIVNADVNSAAAIAYSKLALAGTITSSDIANDTIVDGDINTAANIAWTKIAPSSTVSATELGYLDGVTSAIQTQIDTKLATATAASTYAPLASPALTGTPTAPTATAGTNTTQVATTAYVGTAISNLVAGAPTTLDTLDEIAAAIADTGNFSDTVVLKSGSTMTGALAMGTNKITGLGDPTNAQDAATKYYIDNTVLAPSNLTGPITSVGAATSIASQTGTGTKFVMDTSPTLVTPVLGVATATSINATTIPSTKTLVVTTDKLSVHAATTSAELAGVISDETGSGALVFGTSPTIATPVISSPKISSTYSAKTAAYTFASGDEGNLFSMNNAASVQFNIPTDATFNFAIGTELNVFWITGAGQPTIGAVTPGTTTVISTGATSATPKLRAVNAGATIKKLAANSWIVFGDIA